MKYVVNGKEFDNLEEAKKFEEEFNAKNKVDVEKRVKEIDAEIFKLREEHEKCLDRIKGIAKETEKLFDERVELSNPAEAFELLIELVKEELK